ncbi:ATP-dependent DNA helicase DinG [Bacillus suaedaesalsae]|uniref:3'-5' exonuclease DinG n=1 Tax=Bacillus suaedaesalsae TaxID=2810349 RepID=A0ABS2DNT9_9BACI|nr:ATP-dependent DNA helicase DinG [Bacillus suaedaesalsae]MBM6619830.1 ATP-dependent DNA helicase DinG [Bacillus suaedaesalsae]
MMNKFVVVDLETTGNSPKKGDKIIQFGAVVFEKGEITHTYSTFLNPDQPISPFIEQLTGINDKMLEDAPLFEEVAPIIVELLEDAYFVAHNVLFDLSFLQEELKQSGHEQFLGPVLDTVEMSRFLFPKLTSYRLGGIAEHFNFNHDRPHQADSDAEVTALLLGRLLDKLQELPYVTLKKLLTISANFTSDLEELIEELVTQKEKKQHEDILQFDVHRGIALRKRKEVFQPQDQVSGQFSYSSIRQLFRDFVMTERLFSHGELRSEQLQMMDIIQNAFHDHEHCVIEAGTGLGKTVGYLIPAVIHSLTTRRPVVISTYSVELQNQLIERDFPVITELFPFNITAVTLKGRSHYISLSRFEAQLKQVDNNYDSNLTKAKILVWLTETSTGDIDEINLPSGGHILWDKLSTDFPEEKNHKDPWQSRCFYRYTKTRAEEAQIIITNHALFCRDLIDEKTLPSYNEVIIDEAHHLEDVVSEYLGKQLDYVTIHYTLGRLGNKDDAGIISSLYKICKKKDVQISSYIQMLQDKKNVLKEEMDDLFRMLRSFVLEKTSKESRDNGRRSYTFQSGMEKGSTWNAILECIDRIKFTITEGVREIERMSQQMEHEMLDRSFQVTFLLSELQKIAETMLSWKLTLNQLFFGENDNRVTWIEVEEKGALNSTYLYEQPLFVSDTLADNLFGKKKSVILTSATLTTKQTFTYIKARLGLNDFNPTCISLLSPFNYEEQAQVLIPTDLPNVKDVTGEEYIYAISTHISAIAKVTKGRMLVLFTSYDMLKKTFYTVKDKLGDDGITLLGQGVTSGSRAKLSKTFIQSEHSILFGTSSYWEGVDFPGDSLNCLIIVRLPFTPPSMPLFEAKAREIEANGGNSFSDLSLPQAILRFKQGFGRLIRSRQDKGTVFVFDKRIVTTWYGRQFLDSLPTLSVKKGSLSKLLVHLEEFLN